MNNNARYEAMARLPVYTPLYYGQWDIKSRAMRLDQDFNCHSFIIKKNLVTKKYIGGWNNYKHGGGSVKYFKFKDNTHSWVLPVYEGSYTAQHPTESFPWNKSCKFVGEVTEAEYNKQFEPEPELDLIYY